MVYQLGGPEAAINAVKKTFDPRLPGFGVLSADEVLAPKKKRAPKKKKDEPKKPAAGTGPPTLPKAPAKAPPPSPQKASTSTGLVVTGGPAKKRKAMHLWAREALTNIKNKVLKRKDEF